MTYLFELWVARGWKGIAARLECSVSTAKRLFKKRGLPLRLIGGQWTLNAVEYLEWSAKQPNRKGAKRGKQKT